MAALPKMDKIWMNGLLVDWDDCQVHVLTHALHYGSGVFEGIRCYETADGPAVFRLTEHMKRLERSAKMLRMPLGRTVEELVDATRTSSAPTSSRSATSARSSYRGYGVMGLNPLPAPVDVLIAVWPWDTYLGEEGMKHGVTAGISSWRQRGINSMPPARPRRPATTRTPPRQDRGARPRLRRGDHAQRGRPRVRGHGREPLRRARTASCSRRRSRRHPRRHHARRRHPHRRRLRASRCASARSCARDLYVADEVFMCGTAAEVVPVRAVDGREIGEPGPVTGRCSRLSRHRRGAHAEVADPRPRTVRRRNGSSGSGMRDHPLRHDPARRHPAEGLSLSVEDKLRIARAGRPRRRTISRAAFPASNPKDAEFFARMERRTPRARRLVAFGSTRARARGGRGPRPARAGRGRHAAVHRRQDVGPARHARCCA